MPVAKKSKPIDLKKFDKMSVTQLIDTLGGWLSDKRNIFNENFLGEEESALSDLEDDISDEDGINRALDSLDISEQVAELERELEQLKAYQAVFKKHRNRIFNHIADELVECPRCNHKFHKDSV